MAAWCGFFPSGLTIGAAPTSEGLAGRVLCGYQGWFASEGDGAGIGWSHWRRSDVSLPVVFPGFSWKNLKGGPLDQIPRRRGQFFERQILDATGLGARSIYVAMFDECDEGTAIFKCAEPPRGLQDRFVGLDGLPSDHYLRLAGNARRHLQTQAPRSK